MLLFVNLAPVCNPDDADKFRFIINQIDYAPVANSNAPQVPVAFQFLTSWRPGIAGKGQDLAVNSPEHRIVERV